MRDIVFLLSYFSDADIVALCVLKVIGNAKRFQSFQRYKNVSTEDRRE